jgi:hypothetical protein
MDEHIIHIMWSGPHSLAKIKAMTGPTDKGLYQVYGYHPVYHQNLVYIGKTIGNTEPTRSFSDRIQEHGWESGSENDPDRVEYYVGRLMSNVTPSIEGWIRDIKFAETLLIHAHGPAYNGQSAYNPPDATTHGHIRVLNWGAVRSLHREVSGLVWTKRAEVFKRYSLYGDTPTQPMVVVPALIGKGERGNVSVSKASPNAASPSPH